MARRSGNTHPRGGALVAAARLLDTGGKSKVKIVRQDWQEDCWEYFDAVPEVKHSVRYVGNGMAKLKLFPAVDNPDPTKGPISVIDPESGIPANAAALMVLELARLRSERGGQSEILRQLGQNLEVAAEGFIVGIAEHQRPVTIAGVDGTEKVPESWEVHSISEVDHKDGKYTIKAGPNDTKPRTLGAEDTCIRIWQRHPRWAEQPDCALAGCLTVLEALHTLALQIIGESNSKRNNGFILVPNEITFANGDQTKGDTGEDDDPDEDKFMEALAQTMQAPIADPSSASSVQPTLVRGPAEALKEFRHVLASRNDSSIDEKIEKLVGRLARGLDLPVEVVMGHMSTTFANAGQIDQDTFDDYMQPRAELLVDAITFGFYKPQLLDNAATHPYADRVFVWYDATGLITQPDPGEHAEEAHKRRVISNKAYREKIGFDETDAPTPEEVLERMGVERGILTADLTLTLLKLLEVVLAIDEPAEVIVDDAADPQAVDESGDTAAARRQVVADALDRLSRGTPPRPPVLTASAPARTTTPGARLLSIDQDLRTRLTVAADAAMTRALEKAGNRLRSSSKKVAGLPDTLKGVPTLAVAATLGPALVASLGVDDPLDGAWDELEGQFRSWAARAQTEAVDVASQLAAGFSTSERAALKIRQASSTDEAWTWMRESLQSLAQGRMFDPTPGAPEIGEFDPTMKIPTGLVRQALARAGGATGLVTNGTDAWVSVYPDGMPPGMIATGEDIMGTLAANGAGVEGFAWVYGPASRRSPFEPHRDLDGVTFVNFDDPVLSNTSGWPDDAFYFPGDHGGCLCDFEPVIIPAADAD